jgi:hypothetical protein
MPMELLAGFTWSSYPALANLYRVCRQIPQFDPIHRPFLEMAAAYRSHRDSGTSAGWLDLAAQAVTGLTTIARIARMKIFG